MKVAIVGGGVSGLVCAERLLGTHQVALFEAHRRAGGHADTHLLQLADGAVAVDTGFMVFNDRNYPNFEALLARHRINRQPSAMSFSVSDGQGEFEYNGASPNGLYAVRAHLLSPRFHRMLLDLLRFMRAGPALLASEQDPLLGEWLEEQRYSSYFVERLIVPQLSAVWSARPSDLPFFSARFLLSFFANHGMFSFFGRPNWWTIQGGSQRYVEAVASMLGANLKTGEAVQQIKRDDFGVELTTARGRVERYDAVVLATHSDQALKLLADPSPAEREVLGSIPYLDNEVILHTDHTMLPRRRRAWACWNFHLLDRPQLRPSVTYYLNWLQRLRTREHVLVTLNRGKAVDASKVLKRFTYSHPVFTREAVRAQRRYAEISGKRRTFYCGAYWGYGFHEDGVRSGLAAARALGGR